MAWVEPALGAAGLFQGKMSSNAAQGNANEALAGQKQLTAEQIKFMETAFPFLQKIAGAAGQTVDPLLESALRSGTEAAQFDPHQETERGLQAYDQAANQSAAADLGNASLPASLRGLGGSSEQNGAVRDVIGGRASARGALASSLTMNERNREDQVQGSAQDKLRMAMASFNPISAATQLSGGLQGPSSTLGQQAGYYSGQAAGFNPMSYIQMIGQGMKGVKFPWQKRPGQSDGGDAGAGLQWTGE